MLQIWASGVPCRRRLRFLLAGSTGGFPPVRYASRPRWTPPGCQAINRRRREGEDCDHRARRPVSGDVGCAASRAELDADNESAKSDLKFDRPLGFGKAHARCAVPRRRRCGRHEIVFARVWLRAMAAWPTRASGANDSRRNARPRRQGHLPRSKYQRALRQRAKCRCAARVGRPLDRPASQGSDARVDRRRQTTCARQRGKIRPLRDRHSRVRSVA